MTKYRRPRQNYDQNDGKPGVVYILDNPGLAQDWYKLGQSTHSGAKRANSLNKDASTGTPGEFYCIFEWKTKNCGIAEKRVFEKLKQFRRGKFGQEYFSLDKPSLENAKRIIIEICKYVDRDAEEEEANKQKIIILEEQRIALQRREAQQEQLERQRAKEANDRKRLAADKRREEEEKARSNQILKEQAEKSNSTLFISAAHSINKKARFPTQPESNVPWMEIGFGFMVVFFLFRQCDFNSPSPSKQYAPTTEAITRDDKNNAISESLIQTTSTEPKPSQPKPQELNISAKRYDDFPVVKRNVISRHNNTDDKINAMNIPEPSAHPLPGNAHAHFDGRNWGWLCNIGYIRIGSECEMERPVSYMPEPQKSEAIPPIRQDNQNEVLIKEIFERLDCPIGASQVRDKCVDYRRPFWE